MDDERSWTTRNQVNLLPNPILSSSVSCVFFTFSLQWLTWWQPSYQIGWVVTEFTVHLVLHIIRWDLCEHISKGCCTVVPVWSCAPLASCWRYATNRRIVSGLKDSKWTLHKMPKWTPSKSTIWMICSPGVFGEMRQHKCIAVEGNVGFPLVLVVWWRYVTNISKNSSNIEFIFILCRWFWASVFQ